MKISVYQLRRLIKEVASANDASSQISEALGKMREQLRTLMFFASRMDFDPALEGLLHEMDQKAKQAMHTISHPQHKPKPKLNMKGRNQDGDPLDDPENPRRRV